ncbi:hypothetical protein BCU68_08920 [Vibrio sp. 10N.286.49.B3]|uniref:hypothetical protein n=1 Tax=Vibrio sp. 10N.286.49.B3 TaxID=1880855 RepID=UPI000C838AF6|nr:hypothetical protein [Vibrio sp. 10N.286.49.B3]PMH46181.1 hypothetical protein BCU68_08920 [Vibrio sp. 10N.286.49.B3]
MSALLETYSEIAGPEPCNTDQGFLALVDAHTGLGKTHQVFALQVEHLIADSKKTLIYSTNLRENVKKAYNELLQRIESHGSLSAAQKLDLSKNVIFIPAQATCIEFLSDGDWLTISEVLNTQQIRELKSLRDRITLFTQAKESSNNLVVIEDELRRHYQSIYTLLRSYFRGKGSLSNSVEAILDKVFPARRIDTEQTQVLFLTTSKLLYPWHGIERTYRISDLLSNSLLILDEFDRQQSEFLTHLINTVSDYDIITLTRKFYASFDSFIIQGAPEFAGVDKCFDQFRVALDEYKCKWHVQYRPFIADSTIQEGSENQNQVFTLLTDRMSIHAINFKHEDLKSHINNKNGSHEIGPKGDESAIQFINNGAQLVRIFCKAMLSAVVTLKKNIEALPDSKTYTTENLVAKILNNLGLVEMTPNIMSLISTRLSFKVQRDHKAYSFHDSGYEIANISRFSDADNTCKATTFDLALTSSGLLTHWVMGGAKILGISATATSASAIHNFDLGYLKEALSESLIVLNPSQKVAIQQEYYAKRRYAENDIQINVRSISQRVNWGGIRSLYEKFKGVAYVPQLLDIELCRLLGTAEPKSLNFALGRMTKFVDSIKKFSEHPTNRYHFCMLNNSYKSQEYTDFMVFVGKEFGVTIFENINAASFRNKQFQSVLDLLETTDKKVVVITNYQATGAGLSPSYSIGNNHNFIYVGEIESEPFQYKTDIDSMYLEEPKSLIGSHLREDSAPEDKDLAIKKNIHDILMLHEKGIIAANDAKSQLKSLISSKVSAMTVNAIIKTYKGSEDYRYAVYRFIEQALGRMCRTEWKQQQITIMYDAETGFIKTLANDGRDLAYLSYEYQALITEVKRQHKVIMQEKQYIDYDPKASRNYAHIQRLIGNVYEYQSSDAIDQYDKLRKWMLEKPAMTQRPIGEKRRYYINSNNDMGQYRYRIDYSDEKGITEIFVNPADASGLREVSEVSAKLPLLMRNKIISTHFEINNFATSFESGQFVLAPAMFDLYMGALGEEAVSAILQEFGYKIQTMPDGCVEWFDGYIELGNRILLIDVKHWDLELGCLIHDNTLDKCKTKLDKIKKHPPKKFANKHVQAMYINTIWSGSEGINSRKFVTHEEHCVEHIRPELADVIEIPGIIDGMTGSNNVPPMFQLIELLNQFSE